MPHKLNISTNENDSYKGFRGQVKKEIKIKNKNQSQKNIFNPNKVKNISEEVIMVDENINPNIVIEKKSVNTINYITINNIDEDVEMKIENTNSINIK